MTDLGLLTQTSIDIINKEISLSEVGEYDFRRADHLEETREMREKVKGYRLAKKSTTPWYNPQRILRHFR